MPWTELALNTLALLVYPGGATCLLFGLAAQTVSEQVWGGGARRWAGLRASFRRGAIPPVSVIAVLLAFLAASQLAAPFNPVGATERNLLVAAVALIGATWLALSWRGEQTGPGLRPLLAAQTCWLIALPAPALVSQSLRPQVLGAVVVPGQLPLKGIAGGLFLLCLPALLEVAPRPAAGPDGLGGQPAGLGAVRAVLWLPLCGLFVSSFLPPAADDVLGVLRFAGEVTVTAAAAILIGLAAGRWRLLSPAKLYFRFGAALALLVLALAALADVYSQGLL
jgi:hypothetical protein